MSINEVFILHQPASYLVHWRPACCSSELQSYSKKNSLISFGFAKRGWHPCTSIPKQPGQINLLVVFSKFSTGNAEWLYRVFLSFSIAKGQFFITRPSSVKIILFLGREGGGDLRITPHELARHYKACNYKNNKKVMKSIQGSCSERSHS